MCVETAKVVLGVGKDVNRERGKEKPGVHRFVYPSEISPVTFECIINCIYLFISVKHASEHSYRNLHFYRNRIEKYFIHPPVGEIQICQVAQKNYKKYINIYNDCILDNDNNNNNTNATTTTTNNNNQ